MSENKAIMHHNLPGTDVVGSAVGVPGAQWYVAIVKHNTERISSERLAKMGLESYFPAQKEMRVWRNGRKSVVDKVVIPSVVFVHCPEATRREIVKLPFIHRFLTDKAAPTASEGINKPLAIIPDSEIRRLKFMLGQSDVPVSVTDRPYQAGDHVRVIRGSLIGLEGNVIGADTDKSDVIVTLNHFGYAKLRIDTVNLEIVNT